MGSYLNYSSIRKYKISDQNLLKGVLYGRKLIGEYVAIRRDFHPFCHRIKRNGFKFFVSLRLEISATRKLRSSSNYNYRYV